MDDILTNDERIRFECLVLANAFANGMKMSEVVARATFYEEFIKNGSGN